jgi:transcriptional regulator of acetoin/glycerol metabolism
VQTTLLRVLEHAQPVAAARELPVGEREGIVEALALANGERKTAAALLGVSRATLYRRLARYGIE